jgi:hypothetical protein
MFQYFYQDPTSFENSSPQASRSPALIEYKDDGNTQYIMDSIMHIDHYISNNEYRKALWLLVVVLHRVNGNEKIKILNYYDRKLVPK